MAEAKKKKGFRMPHLLFLMLGLILFMSLMTYVIPAGEFAVDPETNALIGTDFRHVENTPVNPWQAMLLILPGLTNAGLIIGMLLASGGAIGVILDLGALDEMISWAIYKLKNAGTTVLVPMLFFAIGLLGGFGGGDQMVAMVPIGVMFARKLKLDPIVATSVTFMASMVGFATGPTRLLIPQTMMDIPVYSGFGMRLAIMIFAIIVGALYTLWYAKRIEKDPTKSFMGHTDWLGDVETGELAEVKLNPRAALVTILFFAQYILIVWLMLGKGLGNPAMPAVQIIVSIICGIIYRWKMDDIGNSFAKGVAGMGFVGLIIGMATCMSLVMTQGKILATIVYYATLPLRNLSFGLVAIGISLVILVINFFIPSASSKAAILIPIIKPMTEALGIHGQIACQAFQVGDGFTNSITPALGWTSGSLQTAKVEFPQWWKFALPLVGILMIIAWVQLYALTVMGWTGM